MVLLYYQRHQELVDHGRKLEAELHAMKVKANAHQLLLSEYIEGNGLAVPVMADRLPKSPKLIKDTVTRGRMVYHQAANSLFRS